MLFQKHFILLLSESNINLSWHLKQALSILSLLNNKEFRRDASESGILFVILVFITIQELIIKDVCFLGGTFSLGVAFGVSFAL